MWRLARGPFEVQTQVEARNVIFSAPVHAGTGIYPASRTIGMVTVSRWYNGQTVTLITHPYLGPRLKMSNLYLYSPLGALMHVTTLHKTGTIFKENQAQNSFSIKELTKRQALLIQDIRH